MRCFYLKIGKGNSLAIDWLGGNNPLGYPAAVIFFERCTIEDIRNGKSDSQAKDFYQSGLPEVREQILMIVIGHGSAWFLKPAGELMEYDSPLDAKNLWKIMPVEIIASHRLNQIPPVLAGINANTYLNQGTYREIKNWGNIKAIYYSLNLPLPKEHLSNENCNATRLLECLSSVELETLVAKLFEAAGCFVPAYRGGCIKDVDLFAHNEQNIDVNFDGLIIPSRKGISIQVKGRADLKECPKTVDCLIGFEVPRASNCFDGKWLLSQVKAYPNVANWLRRSLSWLPQEFISNCGL
jgi:hypothetical protein